MKFRFKHIVILLMLMLGIHVFANLTGMYETEVIWIDKVLHVMAGVAIGMVWLIIAQKKFGSSEKLINFMSLIGFVLLLALVWEIGEFIFWKGFPAYAKKLELFSPHVKDVVTDMTANLVGGVLLGFRILRKN